MATEKQIKANRNNSLKSTGPQSVEGKEKIKLNATKHGLLSKRVCLVHEDRDEFENFRNSFIENLSPEGPLESLLVERIVAAAWRLKRVLTIETGLLESGFQEAQIEWQQERFDSTARDLLEMANRNSLNGEKVDYDALDNAYTAMKAHGYFRHTKEVALGRSFEISSEKSDLFTKLLRYENAIQRSMMRNLKELQGIQSKNRPNMEETGKETYDSIELD